MEEGGSNKRMAVHEQTVDQTCSLQQTFRDVQGDQMLAHRPNLLRVLSTCHHVSGLARLLVPSAVSLPRQIQQRLQPLVQGRRFSVFALTVKVGLPSQLQPFATDCGHHMTLLIVSSP